MDQEAGGRCVIVQSLKVLGISGQGVGNQSPEDIVGHSHEVVGDVHAQIPILQLVSGVGC